MDRGRPFGILSRGFSDPEKAKSAADAAYKELLRARANSGQEIIKKLARMALYEETISSLTVGWKVFSVLYPADAPALYQGRTFLTALHVETGLPLPCGHEDETNLIIAIETDYAKIPII